MTSLRELAELVGGRIIGDPDLPIIGAAPFDDAEPGTITFSSGRHGQRQIEGCPATAVIVPPGEYASGKTLLVTANPKAAFAKILSRLTERPFEALGISTLAVIGARCTIPDIVSIHPFVQVGDNVTIGEEVTLHSGVSVGEGCSIGRGSMIHSNVVLYPGVQIGERVTIHAGTVIGSDGFGYVFDEGRQLKVPQTGGVEIGDDVEIGANCAIDRATFGATVIEDHVKIDNLVHVAHNCRIGANTVIVGCCGISGSVQIGRNCILAGQVGIADHIRIGDGARLLARAAVFKDVPAGAVVSGTPARDHREELRAQASLRRLPDVLRNLRAKGGSGTKPD